MTPSNSSIRSTREKNAKYAAAQVYGSEFRMGAEPRKPENPIYMAETKKIAAFLDNASNFVHPALPQKSCLPGCFDELLKIQEEAKKNAKQGVANEAPKQAPIEEDVAAIMAYFNQEMKDIVTQESININASTLQINATQSKFGPLSPLLYKADFA
jgi:hypothetical protein